MIDNLSSATSSVDTIVFQIQYFKDSPLSRQKKMKNLSFGMNCFTFLNPSMITSKDAIVFFRPLAHHEKIRKHTVVVLAYVKMKMSDLYCVIRLRADMVCLVGVKKIFSQEIFLRTAFKTN